MKKLISLLCAMLLLALPTLALADDAHLTVTGTATITLPADRAILSIGVRTTAATATDAAAQNADGITALLAALEAAGILPEDITTAEYNIYPNYDYIDGVSSLTGYQITNMLSVVVRDVTQIGKVLDAAINAGANETYGISFTSTRQAEAQDEALTAAIAEAQRKGALMAEAAGMQLGGIEEITENGGGYAVYSNAKFDMAAGMVGSTTILADGVDVTATVTITFELK